MKQVKMTIGGKTYKKARPTVGDWLALSEFCAKWKERPVADGQAVMEMARLLASYYGAPIDQVERCDLSDVLAAFRAASCQVAEAVAPKRESRMPVWLRRFFFGKEGRGGPPAKAG